MTTGWTRIGFFVLVATMLIAGSCGEADAKTGKGRWHARYLAAEGHATEPARAEQAPPAPMRYYGGPKSPMWRGPVEN